MDQPGHLKVTKSEDYKALLPIAIWGRIMDITPSRYTRQLESFEMRCLRVILGVHLMDRVKNEEIRQRLNIPNTICEEVSKRRMKWLVMLSGCHITVSHCKYVYKLLYPTKTSRSPTNTLERPNPGRFGSTSSGG